jgi:hypothetical protein
MHTTAQRGAQVCPFCLVGPVSPVLREHQITGVIAGEEPLSEMQAFACTQGHVFFVAQGRPYLGQGLQEQPVKRSHGE